MKGKKLLLVSLPVLTAFAFAAAAVIWRKDPMDARDSRLDTIGGSKKGAAMGLLRVHPENGQHHVGSYQLLLYLSEPPDGEIFEALAHVCPPSPVCQTLILRRNLRRDVLEGHLLRPNKVQNRLRTTCLQKGEHCPFALNYQPLASYAWHRWNSQRETACRM